MTTRTRRALYRVRNAAHRFVQAVEALGPKDLAELPWWTRYVVGRARSEAKATADKLTGLLHFGEGLPGEVVLEIRKYPTLASLESFAKARDPEDALMEARDAAADAAQETARRTWRSTSSRWARR